MENQPGGISQSNMGSMSGGMQAAIRNRNQQTMTTQVVSADKMPSQAEIVKLLAHLEALIQASKFLEVDKEKATKSLGASR